MKRLICLFTAFLLSINAANAQWAGGGFGMGGSGGSGGGGGGSYAAKGDNSDITSLTGLTGASTAVMDSDVVPITLKGKSSGQTKHLQEWRRGSDGAVLGYAAAGDSDPNGADLYYLGMKTTWMTSTGPVQCQSASVNHTVLISPAGANSESNTALLHMHHKENPVNDFIYAQGDTAPYTPEFRFKVDKTGAVTSKSYITAQTGDITATNGDIVCDTNGKGLKLKRGATLLDSASNEATLTGTLKISNPLGVASGGTGLTTLGTASQQIRVNSGGTALEWFTPTAGAAAGANTDITSLALTGPSTAVMASDACPLTLRGAPLINGGANGQTKHLLEFRRGQDNLLLGYAGAHDYDPSGDKFYYITMGTQVLEAYNYAAIGKSLIVTPAQNGGEGSGPLLSLLHQASPTKDFINAGVGIDESDVRFKVNKDGAVTAASTVTTPALAIPAGSNKKIGSGTLSSGTVTISNTAVTSNSKIFITPTSTNANAGILAVTAKTAATSFVVTSSNGSDDNTFDFIIVEAP